MTILHKHVRAAFFTLLIIIGAGRLYRALSSEITASHNIPAYLHGPIVPLITPYKGENARDIDTKALRELVDYLCTTRISALFPVSGTGQWRLLNSYEKKIIIDTCVTAAQKRKPVLAGVGSMDSLDDVLEVARFAVDVGVDGIVVVTPEYIRRDQPEINGQRRIVNQQLLIEYYTAVSQSVACPVIVYDSDAELTPETMKILIELCPNIKGIKYSQKKDMSMFKKMKKAMNGKAAIFSGSENVALAAIQQGADGMIGNGLNVVPNVAADLMDACDAKDWKKAKELQEKLTELNKMAERLGGGAQGIKKILNDVIGVPMTTLNRGDNFRTEAYPGEYQEILDFYRKLNLPLYTRAK